MIFYSSALVVKNLGLSFLLLPCHCPGDMLTLRLCRLFPLCKGLKKTKIEFCGFVSKKTTMPTLPHTHSLCHNHDVTSLEVNSIALLKSQTFQHSFYCYRVSHTTIKTDEKSVEISTKLLNWRPVDHITNVMNWCSQQAHHAHSQRILSPLHNSLSYRILITQRKEIRAKSAYCKNLAISPSLHGWDGIGRNTWKPL